MPQLEKDQAKSVGENEGTDFPVGDEGFYWAKLLDVRVSDSPGPSGFHYWIWEFGELTNVETNNMLSGRQWLNTSLSPAAEWKLAEVFAAFGVDPKTNTDELLGAEIGLYLSVGIQEKGKNEGKDQNQVERVVSLDELKEGAATE